MSTRDLSYAVIIKYAIKMEQRGVSMYTHAAENVDLEAARNILLFLAEQEKVHEQMFRGLLDDINENRIAISKSIDDNVAEYLSTFTTADIFPNDKPDINIKNLSEVVKVGKETEQDSVSFYTELARFDWDLNSSKILDSIIEEEKKHLVQLSDLSILIDERNVYY